MTQRDSPRDLTLSVPRTGRTWLLLASLAFPLSYATAQLIVSFPQWQRAGIALLFGFGIVLVVWRLLPNGTLVFDAEKGIIMKDGRRLARFADIESVQITEPPLGEKQPYVVELRRPGMPPILVGHADEQIEAASLAARVAGAIDRPVSVAG